MERRKIYLDENHSYSREKTEFNINKDYKNEHANVYFRIDSKHYDYSNNYNCTKEEKDNFDNELIEIFTSLGWEYIPSNRDGVSSRVKKGNQDLYLHPQNFSGTVLKNEIRIIHETLQNRNTFNLRYTDVYETIHDMSDSEYLKYLTTKVDEMKEIMLNCFKTTRANLFVTGTYNVMGNVLGTIKLRRLCDKDRQINKIESELFNNILNELVGKGYLITAETRNGTGYRTINKTEQKRLKLSLAS